MNKWIKYTTVVLILFFAFRLLDVCLYFSLDTFIPFFQKDEWLLSILSKVIAGLVCASAWLLIFFAQKKMPSSIGLGALWVGGICFVAGYIGPLIFMPHANQGPLLGIFFTGPMGVLAGLSVEFFIRW